MKHNKNILSRNLSGENIQFIDISEDWTMDMTGGMKDP